MTTEEMLLKMKKALKADGTLAILDLYESAGLRDLVAGLAAMPVNLALRWFKTGRFREPRQVREVWSEHGRNDTYLSLTQVHTVCRKVLPGAQVRRHLLWRYSLIWRKVV